MKNIDLTKSGNGYERAPVFGDRALNEKNLDENMNEILAHCPFILGYSTISDQIKAFKQIVEEKIKLDLNVTLLLKSLER
jgi:hypothetical protein